MNFKELINIFAYNLISLHHAIIWYIILILSIVYWTLYKIIKEYLWTIGPKQEEFLLNYEYNNLNKPINIISKYNFDKSIKNLKSNILFMLKNPGVTFEKVKGVNNLTLNTTIKNDNAITIISPRLNITNTLPIPVNHSNNYSLYNLFNKNKFSIIEHRDCIAEFNYGERVNFLKDEANILLASKKIDEKQMLFFSQRVESINKSFIHATIIDVLKEEGDTVTFMYNILTTKKKSVSLGGKNIFQPILLYEDNVNGKSIYTVPVTYINNVKKGEYLSMLKFKTEKEHWDNTFVKKILVNNLIKAQNSTTFKQFDIKKDCLEKAIIDIDPDELLPEKNAAYVVTPLEDYIID